MTRSERLSKITLPSVRLLYFSAEKHSPPLADTEWLYPSPKTMICGAEFRSATNANPSNVLYSNIDFILSNYLCVSKETKPSAHLPSKLRRSCEKRENRTRWPRPGRSRQSCWRTWACQLQPNNLLWQSDTKTGFGSC